MKKYGCILLIFCFHLMVFSQKPTEKKADLLFEKKSYLKAAAMYEKLEENQNTLQNLGDCYYNNAMMKDAARVYGKLYLIYKDKIDKEYYYKYAQALLGTADQS